MRRALRRDDGARNAHLSGGDRQHCVKSRYAERSAVENGCDHIADLRGIKRRRLIRHFHGRTERARIEPGK